MARNENWTAVADKAKGDEVKIVLRALSFSAPAPARLVDGTIVKATSATRIYTIEGATRDGSVRLGARQYNATENRGFASIDGSRFEFFIATQREVERLTDPNRLLREALADALRDLPSYRPLATREEIADLLSSLRAATAAAGELDAALADNPR